MTMVSTAQRTEPVSWIGERDDPWVRITQRANRYVNCAVVRLHHAVSVLNQVGGRHAHD